MLPVLAIPDPWFGGTKLKPSKFWLFAALACAALPLEARAAENWWRASSDHFVVYSQGTQDDARKLAISLERLDQAERYMRHLKPDERAIATSEKLTIYQFGETAAIGALYGEPYVAGFFVSRPGNSVAFVPLRANRDGGSRVDNSKYDLMPASVLFHEYTHYFMYQHAAAAYPIWYSEGFAELFSTLVIQPRGFVLGQVPAHRQLNLKYETMSIARLLNPPKDFGGLTVGDVYAGGWLMTSYLTFEPSRAGQLDDYLRRLNRGETKLDAAKNAFGDLSRLTSDIDAYRRGKSRIVEVKFTDYATPETQVSPVPADMGDAMMLRIRLDRGVTRKKANGVVPMARRLAARYPDNADISIMAADAELKADNVDEAEALGKRALAASPKSAQANMMLARIAMRRAQTDPAAFKAARAHYLASNHADDKNAEALYGYYLTFVLAGQQPTEDALIALEEAFRLAQFEDTIRETLVWQLLREDRMPEAQAVFGPLVNQQHAGKKAHERWDKVATQLNAGNKVEAMAILQPTIKPRDDDEEED